VLQAYQELATNLLNYHIGLLFLVRCMLEFRCGWFGVVSVLQAYHQELATILLYYHIGRIVLGSM